MRGERGERSGGRRADGAASRGGLWALIGFSVLYFAVTGVIASWKLLWYDELLTSHLARLPRLSDLWTALATGPDLNPPLYHLAARASFAMLGDVPLAGRLPSIVGFWVMGLCLFRFVARRCPSPFAWAAMLFPLATAAYPYAYEARPYGLVLGLCGVALLCWQSAAEGEHRPLALAGLALSLAAAVSSHYYSVFLLASFALGEAARTAASRRPDLPAWAALAVAMAPLAPLLPLIRHVKTYAPTFWARPGWFSVFTFYTTLLADTLPPLVFLLILHALWSRAGRPAAGDPQEPSPFPHPSPLPAHETATAVGLALLPTLEIVAAKGVTGAFTFRYALPAVIGIGLLAVSSAHRLVRGDARRGWVLAVVLSGWSLLNVTAQVKGARDAWLHRADPFRPLQRIEASDLPIAVADPVLYVRMAYYAPAPLASRLLHVSRGSSHAEREVRDLKAWAPLRIVDYEPFVRSHDRFLVYGQPGDVLVDALLADGARVELAAAGPLLRVEMRPNAAPDPRAR